ncbi:MAG: YggS family pyridoxal phosphate-dependent enzyme [Candidatus Kryptoniota bacterium]
MGIVRTATSLTQNAAEIERRISQAIARSDNPSREVKLIAVSKTFPAAKITEAMDVGFFRFGENRVQEIASKYDQLKNKKAEWHFIGHLQTNKVKKLLEVPTKYIHSVDRLELAAELDRQLQRRGESREVLIEVNTSGEASKSGVRPEKAVELIRSISGFQNLKVKGLMTIGALADDDNMVRKCFVKLREIFFRVRSEAINNVDMLELSMGMSGDFEIAVEEGATLIRIGTAIFGERKA